MAFRVKLGAGASNPDAENSGQPIYNPRRISRANCAVMTEPCKCQRAGSGRAQAAEAEPLLLGPAGRRCRQGRWDGANAVPPQGSPPASPWGRGLCRHHLPPWGCGGHPALHGVARGDVCHPEKHSIGVSHVPRQTAWQEVSPQMVWAEGFLHVPPQVVRQESAPASRTRGRVPRVPPWLGEAEGSYSVCVSCDEDAVHGDVTGLCDFKTTIRTSSPSLLLMLLITSILSSILPELTVYKPPPAACPL